MGDEARRLFGDGRDGSGEDLLLRLRCVLGGYLLLGLEFLIVSDIIHSVLRRALADLAELGALVAIRTVIAFFLNHEMQRLERR